MIIVGLAGPNGSGKTTLLHLLSGRLEPTTGAIVRRRGLRIFNLERDERDDQSSGERSREALARCMREPTDLYLLDEPTNHLDSDARAWLAHWLVRQNITCVIVSHDRWFLNEVTNRTLLIERGRVRSFAGNYDFAHREGSDGESRRWSEFDAQQHSHDFYMRKAAKVARTGRILRERALVEDRIGKPWEERAIPDLDFSSTPVCPAVAAHANEACIGYGGMVAAQRVWQDDAG